MHITDNLREADRIMTICNSCRYCEGLCAVFPAMEERRAFTTGDLNYLANLCHSCGACYIDCQFSPPHEFEVNVPKTLAKLRLDTYADYAWPRAMGSLFAHNAAKVSLITALTLVVFLAIYLRLVPHNVTNPDVHSGLFYQTLSHFNLALLFGSVFVYALIALTMGVVHFWRDIDEPFATLHHGYSLWQAIKDAGSLRYLDGAGEGCYASDKPNSDYRRLFHHFTFYGFMLCFASTSVATLYHYFGYEAPYPYISLPVILGTLGGIGLTIGPIGLMWQKNVIMPELKNEASKGVDYTFLLILLLVGVSGLALLILRNTDLLNVLLAAHLAFVWSFFLIIPYSKMVHGLYRFTALVRYATEMQRAKLRAAE